MLKKFLLGTLSAALFSAILVPNAHAASMDLNLPGGLTNVTDVNGHLTGSTLSTFILSIVGGPLNNDMVTGPADSFSFSAFFNTTTNALISGSFSLTGSLHDASLSPNPTAITFTGAFTGLTVQNTDQLVFTFNATPPGSPTAADTLFDSNFGPKGIFQLTLPSAPGALGGSFTPTAGPSAVDVTAVPTPNAGFAGLMLLGGIAGVRYLRKRSPVC